MLEKIRGFERLSTTAADVALPKRGTAKSAGYDISVINPVVYDYMVKNQCLLSEAVQQFGLDGDYPSVTPDRYGIVILPTGLKAYMPHNEVLTCFVRSSIGIKQGMTLANGTAIIDADYYNNPKNEGHIMIALKLPMIIGAHNVCHYEPLKFLEPTLRVAQGIFSVYHIIDNDDAASLRTGGVGSTGR